MEGHSWQYVLCSSMLRAWDDPPGILAFLRDRGINAGVHYPAIHTFPCIGSLAWSGRLPQC